MLIVQEAGWAPGPVWTGAENLASAEIRSPDRPTLYRVAALTELSRPSTDYSVRVIAIMGSFMRRRWQSPDFTTFSSTVLAAASS